VAVKLIVFVIAAVVLVIGTVMAIACALPVAA
jgi:hypothetical protein